jgi:hypothetical protein
MPRIKLSEPLRFGGIECKEGDEVDATDQEARILVALKRALVVETSGEVPSSRRAYKRRDLRAQQYGVK